MKIDVSIGEAIDKLNILELKYKKITNKDKLIEIKKEIDVLSDCNSIINKYYYYYNILSFINEEIWNLTDLIKSIDINNENYSKISYSIFDYNQKRFRIKNFFNILINSNINEQKSYNSTYLKIIIDEEIDFYDKLPELNFLTIEYDYVILEINYVIRYPIKNILLAPNILYDFNGIDNIHVNVINIKNVNLHNEIKNKYFCYPCINYISAGKLGDLIQSLSVMNEIYLSTGKKGNLYICETYDGIIEKFSFSLEKTFKDTFEVFSQQKYMNNYQIFNNEKIDINLNDWRKNQNIHMKSIHQLYNETYCKYNIEWGKNKWLNINTIDKKWNNTVFLFTTNYRFPNCDFNKLFSMYGDNLVFLSYTKDMYDYFIDTTKLNIKLYMPKSFTEACILINSCKLLISCLTSTLSLGHAIDIPRIVLLNDDKGDIIRNNEFDKLWDNIYYYNR